MSYCLNPTCSAPQNLSSAGVCAACRATLRLHDRYRALKPIAQGGFGRTFLAVDEAKEHKPLCVIKQFFPQTLGAENLERARELFQQEALRLKELGSHDQIPELLDSLEQDDRQYLIQEFIDGQNLEQELQQGAFREAQICQLLLDLLPVLQFVHDRQVIHRDIKPANIIRRQSDQKLVLVDLGAAKYATGTALAKTGTVIGSAEYTAPEQARGKAVFASDLYSLGATCIHLLTQMSPFDLFDSSDDRWAWRDCLKSPVSQSIDRILHKMLESGTNRRYQTATQVLADLNPTTQPYPKITSPVVARTTAQSGLPNQHFDRRDEMISALEPETRSWQWDIADGKVQRVPVYPDVQVERSGKVASAAERRSIVTPRSQQKGRVKAVLILALITLFPLWFAVFASPNRSSRTEDRSPAQTPRETVRLIRTVGSSGIITSIALSPDGKTLASSTMTGIGSNGFAYQYRIEIHNLEAGKQPNILLQHAKVNSITVSPDGETLIGGDDDGVIKFWNLKTSQLVHEIQGHSQQINSVAISPDGQTLATGSFDNTTKLWNLQTKTRVRTLHQNEGVGSIAISPDGRVLASSTAKTINLWDLHTGQQLKTLHGNANRYSSIAITSNGLVVAGGADLSQIRGVIDLWRLDTGIRIRTITDRRQRGTEISAIAVSPDGQTLAGSSIYRTTIDLWNPLTEQDVGTVAGHPIAQFTTLAFDRSGNLVSGNKFGTIEIWKLP